MSTITAEVSEGTKTPNGSGMPERLGLKILIISGFREGDARYGVLYLTDPYEGFFQKIMKTDGFDTVIFIINEASTAGVIAWNSSVKGWVKGNGDLENDLRAAEITDFEPWVELLVGGIANREIANEHPDWRQKDQNGRFIEYMGEQMCMNSPYWNQYLLPLYGELFQKFGKKIKALVLWEGPFDERNCMCEYCKKTFSEIVGTENWTSKDILEPSGRFFWKWIEFKKRMHLERWKDIRNLVKEVGWNGLIIGGGWAAYEWEEKMWDKTFYIRNTFWAPEFDAFKEGIVDAIMPELLIHSTYGPHEYRREDAHYVYRSLTYERSLFGDKIIPNVELYWERAMTPDELFRWLLEVWSAGFSTYSVVNGEKLYIEEYDPLQVVYRPMWRVIFREFNKLPYFGLPAPNFYFIVSGDLEQKALKMDIWDWYVTELNKLFKTVDRVVTGGSFVNEKIMNTSSKELYGVFDEETPWIMIVPKGFPEPYIPDEVIPSNVLKIYVEPREDLEKYAEEIIGYINAKIKHKVVNKSPLVYVNWNSREDGKSYISIINHGAVPGEVQIKIPWNGARPIINSSLIDKSFSYRVANGWLSIRLEPYAAVVFSEAEGASSIPVGDLQVVLKDRRGEPIRNARVCVLDVNVKDTTDLNGTSKVLGLRAGDHKIEISYGELTNIISLKISPSVLNSYEVTLEPSSLNIEHVHQFLFIVIVTLTVVVVIAKLIRKRELSNRKSQKTNGRNIKIQLT